MLPSLITLKPINTDHFWWNNTCRFHLKQWNSLCSFYTYFKLLFHRGMQFFRRRKECCTHSCTRCFLVQWPVPCDKSAGLNTLSFFLLRNLLCVSLLNACSRGHSVAGRFCSGLLCHTQRNETYFEKKV